MAASCGRAIIASDLPVLVDLADQERSGFLFKSEDPADLARVIEGATRADVPLAEIGARAKETVARERNFVLIGEMTAQLYARARSADAGH
jgi:glycosyltransferase involved in cell wall biosynthesis